MDDIQSKAAMWCEYMKPDRTCYIMDALSTESDSTCKCFRPPERRTRCRYLELVVLNTKGARRGGRNFSVQIE